MLGNFAANGAYAATRELLLTAVKTEFGISLMGNLNLK
jgi:hypothetical protein